MHIFQQDLRNNFLLHWNSAVMGNATISSSMNYYTIHRRSINTDICQALIAVARFYIYKNQTLFCEKSKYIYCSLLFFLSLDFSSIQLIYIECQLWVRPHSRCCRAQNEWNDLPSVYLCSHFLACLNSAYFLKTPF